MTSLEHDNGLFIAPHVSLLDAMRAMDKNSKQLLIVIDEERRLLGAVTDGDIRRAILHGAGLDKNIEDVMNRSPKVAKEGELRSVLLRRMRELQLHFLPKIDSENRVVDVIKLSDMINPEIRKNKVVIMAGGRGTRLGKLTENCPKPMLKIGGKPMLEVLVELFASFGFYDFVISVHYLKEQIIDHFGDGSKFGVSVSYLEEQKPLGTAGTLSSLEPSGDDPFIVINGDIYTDMDFSKFLDFHLTSNSEATVCLRELGYQIPYGVVRTSGENEVLGIDEKPELTYLINAGIYVFNPSVIDLIPKNEFFLMTALIEELLNKKKTVKSYMIDGFWLDIGHNEDLGKALGVF